MLLPVVPQNLVLDVLRLKPEQTLHN
jgi:hypothetical protein